MKDWLATEAIVAVLSFVLILPLPVLATSGTSQEPAPVIVGFKDKPDPALVRSVGGQVKYVYEFIPAIAASVPAAAKDALRRNPNVVYVEDDQQAQASCHTNDFQTTPWGVTKINAPNV